MENDITMKFSILHGCMDEKTLKQLLDLYHKWQDEIDRYMMYNFFYYSRPRGLAKGDIWWYNAIQEADEFVKFRKEMEKDLEFIRNPYRYDYGHYFVNGGKL